MKSLLDEIHSQFQSGDFENDSRLSGAYLLGYHCQRRDLAYKKPSEETEE
jgi:CRISPR-associated protein Csd1